MKLFTWGMVGALALAFTLASVTPAYADGMPKEPAVKKTVKKPKQKPVQHTYTPVPEAPVYNPPPPVNRVVLQPEPEPLRETELDAYAFIESKHSFNRHAFIDHDDCAYGGGLKLTHAGFFVGAEGLTECSDGVDVIKRKKKYGWGYKYTTVDEEFDRVALYGGWHGYVHDAFVLDVHARHEFASNDRDVTLASALIGYDFNVGKDSTITPYTGVEVLLTDREDEPCIDDTNAVIPVGIRTKLALGENFSLFGDGSVNFSDDRDVAVVEAGAHFNFDIAGMPMVLTPSGAWVNRFDGDDESAKKYGGYGYKYSYHCYGGNNCEQDDQYWVGKVTLTANISDIVN